MLLIQSTILLANLEFHTHIKQADVYNLLFVIPHNCAERTEPSLLFSLPAARAASRRQVPSETQPYTHQYTIIWISQFHSLSPLMPCSVDTAGSSFLFGSVFFFLKIPLLLLDCHWIHSGSAYASELNWDHFWPRFGPHQTNCQNSSQKGEKGKFKLSSQLVLLLI